MGFWDGLNGFAGGLAQGIERGQEANRRVAADKRAQEEFAHNKKGWDDEERHKQALAEKNQDDLVFTGKDFGGKPPLEKSEPARLWDNISGATPPASPPPQGMPSNPLAPSPQVAMAPTASPMVAPQLAAPPAQGIPSNPMAAPPPPDPASLNADFDRAMAPQQAVPQALPSPQNAAAPAAPKQVRVRDSVTGQHYMVDESETRRKTSAERGAETAAYWWAQGELEKGNKALHDGMALQVENSNFNKTMFSDDLLRNAHNPYGLAEAANRGFKQLGSPMVSEYDPNRGTMVFHVTGTDVPPLYMDAQGQLTQDAKLAGNYNAAMAGLLGFAKGDPLGTTAELLSIQATTAEIASNKQATAQNALLFPGKLETQKLTNAGVVLDNETKARGLPFVAPRAKAELDAVTGSNLDNYGTPVPGSGGGSSISGPFEGATAGQYGQPRSTGDHNARDYSGKGYGTSVMTPKAGVYNVIPSSGANGSSYTQVTFDDGSVLNFVHVQGDPSMNGKRVEAGSVVGQIARLGRMTGPNAHLTYRDANGNHMDPAVLFGSNPPQQGGLPSAASSTYGAPLPSSHKRIREADALIASAKSRVVDDANKQANILGTGFDQAAYQAAYNRGIKQQLLIMPPSVAAYWRSQLGLGIAEQDGAPPSGKGDGTGQAAAAKARAEAKARKAQALPTPPPGRYAPPLTPTGKPPLDPNNMWGAR